MHRLLFALLGAALATGAAAQYRGELTVTRVLLDARITDYKGNPIRDLRADDFEVRIGGRTVEVDAVEWIEEAQLPEVSVTDELTGRTVEPLLPAPPRIVPATTPRTVIVFVQTDFARNTSRVRGQMKFRRFAEKIISTLAPSDRVAVFSFDSHLKFRSDLTTDKLAAVKAFRETLWIDHPPPPPAVPSPSLAAHLNRNEMQRASTSEAALRLLGDALSKIDGPKTLLLLGWGLGERVGKVVRMRRDWPAVRRQLDAARVTLFALDTTYADYHDLEIGMRRAADETGGFYAKTHEFPEIAMERFRRTVSGRYELTLRPPAQLARGTHAVTLRVKRRGIHVLAPDFVAIR